MICIFWFDCSIGYCGPLKLSYSDFISHMVVCGGEDQIQYNCDVVDEEEARVGLRCTVFVSMWHVFIIIAAMKGDQYSFIVLVLLGWWPFRGEEIYMGLFVFEINEHHYWSWSSIIGLGSISWSNLDPGSKLYLTLKMSPNVCETGKLQYQLCYN